MTKQDIRDTIFKETGIDTRSRKMRASMKEYTQFYIHSSQVDMLKFSEDYQKEIKARFLGERRTFTSSSTIEIHNNHIHD